ncbi:OmpH family outer membrane protein [Leptobacterium flavescens]|uniref:OmpH family outer membrane protein n=1 Tax=Leptobacterium flavescens TaxID=472055 RepID=A0A6P0UQA5_9FLAO|nr:OmpH family outer membrane protein [Leptobacterium flavescens]NER12576.1 OmpH family outer membrane protein [Leptobacterium flavescens]
MKTKVLLLLLTFFALSVQAQRGVRIGYIDMEYILENVPEYQEANEQLNAKVQKWKIEIEQKKSKVEQMKKDLNAEKVLLTKELIQEKEEDIEILEKEMLKYQQDRFGPEGDLVIQRRLLVQPIQDQVFNAVREIASGRKYDFIFDKSADVVMLYSDKKYDISELVLRRINVVRKQDERKARSKAASEKDKFEAVPNPEVEARQKAADERRDQKAKDLEARRQQKLKEREELKKAYEERRKKLLAEREARKKAAQEAREKKKKEKENKEKENGSEKKNDN